MKTRTPLIHLLLSGPRLACAALGIVGIVGIVGVGIGCGGGGGGGVDSGVVDGALSDGESGDPQVDAMSATAEGNPLCQALGEFYWAVGDASGEIGTGVIGTSYAGETRMPIFSASKLLFAAYVVEDQPAPLDAALVAGLNFTSGYVEQGLKLCVPADTVGSCFENELNNYQAAMDGSFNYASGHMQKIAALDLGLAALDRQGFADEMMTELGTDLALQFDVNLTIAGTAITAGPIAAGGMNTTPDAYGSFLATLVAGNLRMADSLGANVVATPIAGVDYSLGHWVEKNSDNSIDAYSSVGALGFYPWVDAGKEFWGVLARVETDQSDVASAANDSQVCGQQMRRAFLTGEAQL